jgi:hypothetical protein
METADGPTAQDYLFAKLTMENFCLPNGSS